MADELRLSKNAFTRLREYFSDVRVEMRRVTWPGKQEIYGTTLLVILTTFLFAGYFGICDWIFRIAVQQILKLFLRGG